ncbi:MAG: glycosyltransferase, partial [Gammaproteobacteria bacterium]|nr:glycosyltransferase [Gammaproteobacteria bacterium]
MLVVHVLPSVSEEASGPSYSVVRLCESLAEAGDTVTLTAMDWAPITNPSPVLRTFPMGLGPRRLGRSPAMARWLDEQARSGRISVLHNHGMWQMNAVYPGRVASRHGTPYMVSPRGTWSEWAMSNGSLLKRPFWHIVQRPSVDCVTCFHATADSEYEDIRRLGFRQPVAVIPNGVDIP